MTEVTVVEGDISRCEVDAIVNAANAELLVGGGVDGAIHAAGGPAIFDECRAVIARQGYVPPVRRSSPPRGGCRPVT